MYTYTWKKYLPVIRLLLKKSAAGEQILSLNRTDFEKTTKLRKPTCSFSMELIRGRLLILNPPVPAKDLLEILMQDSITQALLRKYHYTISLNSDFQLKINNLTPQEEINMANSTSEEAGTNDR
jgi:hypothetical protein